MGQKIDSLDLRDPALVALMDRSRIVWNWPAFPDRVQHFIDGPPTRLARTVAAQRIVVQLTANTVEWQRQVNMLNDWARRAAHALEGSRR